MTAARSPDIHQGIGGICRGIADTAAAVEITWGGEKGGGGGLGAGNKQQQKV